MAKIFPNYPKTKEGQECLAILMVEKQRIAAILNFRVSLHQISQISGASFFGDDGLRYECLSFLVEKLSSLEKRSRYLSRFIAAVVAGQMASESAFKDYLSGEDYFFGDFLTDDFWGGEDNECNPLLFPELQDQLKEAERLD